jgi:hypothetical protein
MDVTLPDGRVIRGVPDGTTKAQLAAKLKANGIEAPADWIEQPKSPNDDAAAFVSREVTSPFRMARDLAAGGIRGAGSIGATLIRPFESAEENTARRGKIDAALRDLIGADTDSGAYTVGKLGGEIAGTAGVGPALGAAAGAARLPALANALSSAGMTAGRAGWQGLAARMAGGGAVGGGSAFLVNPSDAKTGAVVGAALPPILMGAGRTGKALGAAFTKRGGASAAVERVAQELGPDVRQAVGDLQTYYPRGAENIPVSSAGIIGKPKIVQLEQASRLRNAPAWQTFDDVQSRAVADNVAVATLEADELAARLAARQENWAKNWEKAAGNKQPRNFASLMGQLKGALDQASVSPESANPAVMNLLQAVDSEVARLGKNFDIGHLQQIRANLNGKTQPMSPDAFKAAPRESAAVRSLIAELDDILNKSTKGKWDSVRGGYASDSEKVHQSKAAQKIRDAFIDRDTGRVRGVSSDVAGQVEKITEAGLGRAMDTARLPDKSLALSPQSEARLSATLDALRRQSSVQKLKRSATAGGGSDTVANALSIGARGAPGGNRVLELIDAIGNLKTARTDQAMVNFLQDPDALAIALNNYLAPRPVNPLSIAGYRAAPLIVGDR